MEKCSKGYDHLVDCAAKLHNLRRLSIKLNSLCNFEAHPEINSVAKIIAANPKLTHLEVSYGNNQDLAETLRHLPADPPLKLEHLGLSQCLHSPVALAPHISSLTSIDIVNSNILDELLKQNVFPPTMTFWTMDQYTINYLNRHPRIVSLTNYSCDDASACSALSGILSRHSETLTHLGFSHWVLYNCINQTQNELEILQCTNLKQLLVDYQSIPTWRVFVSGLQRVSSTLSAHPRHVPNATLTGKDVVSNFSPSGLSHIGCQ